MSIGALFRKRDPIGISSHAADSTPAGPLAKDRLMRDDKFQSLARCRSGRDGVWPISFAVPCLVAIDSVQV
jgi:hypothetical protein